MTQALHRLALSLLALPLAACAAGSGDYPSLAIRDAERVEGSFETGTPLPDLPPPPSPLELRMLGVSEPLEEEIS